MGPPLPSLRSLLPSRPSQPLLVEISRSPLLVPLMSEVTFTALSPSLLLLEECLTPLLTPPPTPLPTRPPPQPLLPQLPPSLFSPLILLLSTTLSDRPPRPVLLPSLCPSPDLPLVRPTLGSVKLPP